MQDVAAYANVAKSTVSHVINDTAPISQHTKEKVLQAIHSLGYRPNGLARGLRRNRTNLIGLVIPDISNEFYAKFSRGVMDFGFEHGYTIVMCSTQYDKEREIKHINDLLETRIDGYIFIGGFKDIDLITSIHKSGIPVVLADRHIINSNIPSIQFDNQSAMYKMVTYLIKKGYQKIGYLSEPITMSNLEDRFSGFRKCLLDHGIQPIDSFIIFEKKLQLNKEENAYKLLDSILSKKLWGLLPDAIITTSDLIAIGAIKAIHKAGLKVPLDIAVCGFDDISCAVDFSPSLTTIRQDAYRMGKKAAEVLFDQIVNNSITTTSFKLLPEVIIRESA